jgi:FkbM family methyltransferase
MSISLPTDPSFGFRKIEKLLLALRFCWRLPRRHGAWPKYEYLKPWIVDQRPAIVIDIGVNIGQFFHMAHRLWPEAQLVGIEPTPALHDRMQAIYDGDCRVTLHRCAAGAGDGEAEFHLTRNHQNSSLLPPSASFATDRPDDGVVGAETVALHRMETLLKDVSGPSLVKIDVQGAELAVLKGFGARLADIETLIVEAPFEAAYEGGSSFDDIYRFLTGAGFDYAGPLGTLTSKATGRVRQEDAVYVRRV